MSRAGVGYFTAYLWTCPNCGATWQRRRRPRAGATLHCAAGPEQRLVFLTIPRTGCTAVHESSGQRAGVAPTL